MDALKINSVEEKIITLRGIPVILDSDVAQLYGVGTKEINQAVKNNPEKFATADIFCTIVRRFVQENVLLYIKTPFSLIFIQAQK